MTQQIDLRSAQALNAHQFVGADRPDLARAAREALEGILERGMAKAAPVVSRVLDTVPVDRVVSARSMRFEVQETGRVLMGTSDVELNVHDHAFGQLVERAGINTPYAKGLAVADVVPVLGRAGTERREAVDNAWRRNLLRHTLSEHYRNDGNRYLVRSIEGEARGVLSDRFRRLDSRPLLDAFIGACDKLGARPFEGVSSDIRTSVRVVLPTVYEPVPGEAVCFGLSWTNSDFGAGTYSISAFVLRLICLNGAVGENALRQVHLGRRLDENVEYSARTYKLDTDATVSATQDIIRGTLSEKAIETRMALVRQAVNEEVSFKQAWKQVGAGLTKGEQKATQDAFESKDVVMLPAGENRWRFSNALSWVANATESSDRKLELQRAAGQALSA